MTVKNTDANNGLEARRALNATYDSNNKGRQQSEYACSTCYIRNDPMNSHRRQETVERWEGNVREHEQRFRRRTGRTLKTGVILRTGTAVSAEPLPFELADLEELRAGQADALRLLSGPGR